MTTMSKYLRFTPGILLAASFMVSCSPSPQGGAHASQKAIQVKRFTVRTQTMPQFYKAVGTVESETTSVLGAQLSATVKQITVQPGDPVHKGEVLALLDDRAAAAQLHAAQSGVEAARASGPELQQSLAGAQAELQMAETTFHRYQGLWAKSSVSRQELDQAETRYKSAAARVAALRARSKQVAATSRQAQSQEAAARAFFSYTRIVSPIDGVVTAKNVDTGTLVIPGTPILTVEDPLRLRLVASLPERYQSLVRLGETVPLAVGKTETAGRVAEIAPTADPASRTFAVKVTLPAGCLCRSGDFGTASFSIGQSQGMLIPRSAVITQGELEGVFVIGPKGVAHYRLVKTGEANGEQVEILSGLTEGEKIATSGLERLSDGARVEGQ